MPIVSTSPFFSSNENVPTICKNYTSYLKSITGDLLKPFLVEVTSVLVNHVIEIYITINYSHMKNRVHQRNYNYTLNFKSKTYNNVYATDNYSGGYSQLKFLILDDIPYMNNDIISFTLHDHMQNITYFDVKSCITIPPEKKLPIISCSYISNYNTIAELRSFIAFHRIQGVSKVVFYQSTVIEGFEKAFEKLINSGYLITIDFTWPRPEGICGLKQRTNQLAQINACYNRFRFYADALIMCDVDEYIYSMRFPYNLPDALHYLVETYRKNNVFIVFLTIIMLCSYIQIV